MMVYGIQFWIECKGGLKTANELSDVLDDLVYDGNLSLAYSNHSIMGAGLFMKNAVQNNFESIREILNEFADKIKYVSEWDYEDSSDMKWGVHTLGESKKSARKSIEESLNFKKDYVVEVMGGTYWFKPFYWDFDEFRNDLLIASEEEGFTYYITEESTSSYRINLESNDGFYNRYDITFEIIPKSNKATAKELNNYLN